MRQDLHDRVSLEIARRIARGLPQKPEWIDLARENLARWRRINADAPGLLRCYSEWEALLQKPIDTICRGLTAETDESRRLRQNSPFAGALSPQTIWDIKSHMRNETIAA